MKARAFGILSSMPLILSILWIAHAPQAFARQGDTVRCQAQAENEMEQLGLGKEAFDDWVDSHPGGNPMLYVNRDHDQRSGEITYAMNTQALIFHYLPLPKGGVEIISKSVATSEYAPKGLTPYREGRDAYQVKILRYDGQCRLVSVQVGTQYGKSFTLSPALDRGYCDRLLAKQGAPPDEA